VNQRIGRDLSITAITMPLADAKKVDGVQAVFGEKYPDPVRVVMVGPETPDKANFDDSIEFCGGTHMPRTGGIGYFKIASQEPVAKGVRRIVAVSGRVAAEAMTQLSATVTTLTDRFQCKPDELPTRVSALDDEMTKLKDQLKRAAIMAIEGLFDASPVVNGTKLLVGHLPPVTIEVVRSQIDRIRQKSKSAAIIFGWEEAADKVSIVVALTSDLVAKGVKAGDLIKPIAELVGGKGGGKPDMAQAGGKDVAKLSEALEKGRDLARGFLEG